MKLSGEQFSEKLKKIISEETAKHIKGKLKTSKKECCEGNECYCCDDNSCDENCECGCTPKMSMHEARKVARRVKLLKEQKKELLKKDRG